MEGFRVFLATTGLIASLSLLQHASKGYSSANVSRVADAIPEYMSSRSLPHLRYMSFVTNTPRVGRTSIAFFLFAFVRRPALRLRFLSFLVRYFGHQAAGDGFFSSFVPDLFSENLGFFPLFGSRYIS